MTVLVSRYGVPYMGSKNAIAREIVDQLPPAHTFVDLFAGGCAVTHAAMLSGKYKRFIANDIDFRGITLFRDAVAGKYRDEKRVITREMFNELKDVDPYVALCWSFGNNPDKNYLWGKDIEGFKQEAMRALVADTPAERYAHFRAAIRMLAAYKGAHRIQGLERLGDMQSLGRLHSIQSLISLHSIQGLEIRVGPYDAVEIPAGSVVYCDPPYAGKAEYAASGFDHEKFYDWLRTRDFPVWMSEYAMPGDFKRIWAREKRVTLHDKAQKAMEGLFVHEKWADKVPRLDLFGFDGFD